MTRVSHLGSLVQSARERMHLSQEILAEKLGLARPISVSKWERGACPVPVHHWQPLLRILKITRKELLDAALADKHRQLAVFTSLTGSFASTIGEASETLSWAFLLRSLNPQVATKVEQLRAENRHLTPAMLVNMAVGQFVATVWQELPEAATGGQSVQGRSSVHHLRRGGTPAGAAGFRTQTG